MDCGQKIKSNLIGVENMNRKVKRIVEGESKLEGAGVEVYRVFGKPDVEDFDPFLMMDAFDNHDPDTFSRGFEWHPHRGIETVTYLLEGEIEHSDSIGNSGVIKGGDCQWMTAGSGIIHREMPRPTSSMVGVQLWINLPREHKMTDPKYRNFTKSEIPEIKDGDSTVRLVAGEFKGEKSPMEKITVRPTFMDVRVKPGGAFSYTTESENTLFIYILRGSAELETEGSRKISEKQAVLFDRGDEIQVKAGNENLQFLLISGKPLNEPIEWSGSVVMNTKEELKQAYREIDEGNFIK